MTTKRYISKISGNDYTESYKYSNAIFWIYLVVGFGLVVVAAATRSKTAVVFLLLDWIVVAASFAHTFWLSAFCEWR